MINILETNNIHAVGHSLIHVSIHSFIHVCITMAITTTIKHKLEKILGHIIDGEFKKGICYVPS